MLYCMLSTVNIKVSASCSLIILNAVNRGDTDGIFSIGQTVRIRVGPLKGYLCRILAIRRADITVKLDSQQKVLTGSSISIKYWV